MDRPGWTTERTDRMVNLHFSGLSMAQVAAELGGVTRNAVIGKLHRMGINSAESHDLWTDEETVTLRRGWGLGKTIAEVGAELLALCGIARSANSIACKADRLNLKKRMVQKREFRNRRGVNVADMVLAPAALPIECKPLNVPFMQLEATHCREIVDQGGDGLAIYCGLPNGEGSYCATHHEINHYRVTPAARKW